MRQFEAGSLKRPRTGSEEKWDVVTRKNGEVTATCTMRAVLRCRINGTRSRKNRGEFTGRKGIANTLGEILMKEQVPEEMTKASSGAFGIDRNTFPRDETIESTVLFKRGTQCTHSAENRQKFCQNAANDVMNSLTSCRSVCDAMGITFAARIQAFKEHTRI